MLLAALINWRSGFRATALSSAPAPSLTPETEEEKHVDDSDVLLDLDIQAPMGLDAGLDEI